LEKIRNSGLSVGIQGHRLKPDKSMPSDSLPAADTTQTNFMAYYTHGIFYYAQALIAARTAYRGVRLHIVTTVG